MGEKIRLDRLVASQMPKISRAEVKKLCLKSKISVNGKTVRRSDIRVDTDDEIIVDGKRIEYKKHIYIMLNKPRGVVCSTKEGSSTTVLDLVPEEMRRSGLFPAGRLWEEEYESVMSQGMTIDGGEKCLPAEFKGSKDDPYMCELVLHEGKFHQVKRMFSALGNNVVMLKRIAIGSMALDPELAPGRCLEIMHKDVERLLAK